MCALGLTSARERRVFSPPGGLKISAGWDSAIFERALARAGPAGGGPRLGRLAKVFPDILLPGGLKISRASTVIESGIVMSSSVDFSRSNAVECFCNSIFLYFSECARLRAVCIRLGAD